MAITVTELIEILQELPGDLRILSQIDDEGNGYHNTRGAEIGWIEKTRSHWVEEVHSEEYFEGEDWFGYTPDKSDYDEVVVIY